MYLRNVGNTVHLRMLCRPRVELKSVALFPSVPLLGPVKSADALVIPWVRLLPQSLSVEIVRCHKVLCYFRFLFLLFMGSQRFGALNLTV
jgi:hypothetical protein